MDMDKLVALCRRRGFLVSVERNLRRAQRLLGLRPAGRRAEAEHQRGLVARHGHRPQRACEAAGGAVDLRNGRPRLLDHHAPAGVEVLGALRFVPRHDGRLPADEDIAIATIRFAAGGPSFRRRRVFVTVDCGERSRRYCAAGAEALQAAGQGRGTDLPGKATSCRSPKSMT